MIWETPPQVFLLLITSNTCPEFVPDESLSDRILKYVGEIKLSSDNTSTCTIEKIAILSDKAEVSKDKNRSQSCQYLYNQGVLVQVLSQIMIIQHG